MDPDSRESAAQGADPTSAPTTLGQEAEDLAARGEYWEALAVCERAIESYPVEQPIWITALRCAFQLGLKAQQTELLSRALEYSSNQGIRAQLYFAAGNYADALREAMIALGREPSDIKLRVLAVRAADLQGEWEIALRLCQNNCGSKANQIIDEAKERLTFAVQWAEKTLGQGPHDFPSAVFDAIVQNAARPYRNHRPLVLHVIGSLGAGGAERQLSLGVIETSRRSDTIEPVVAVQTLDPHRNRNFFEPDLVNCGIRIDQLGAAPITADRPALYGALPKDLGRLARQIHDMILLHRPQILHLWLDLPCIAGGIAGLIGGVPQIVLSTRNMRPTERQRSRPYLKNAFLALMSAPNVVMINNSLAGAQDYADWIGLPTEKISSVHNGYDFDRHGVQQLEVEDIRTRLGCTNEHRLLGGVMRLAALKRPMLWLEVAERLVTQRPDTRAVLIGEGPLRPLLEQRVREIRLEDRIHIVGGKSPIEPWMAAMDLLLLTSSEEGLPNVLVEAQSVGTAVAGTDVGGTAETLLQDKTGLLLPADLDAAQAACAIATLFEDRELLRTMGLAGQQWARRRFSIRAAVDRWEEIYGLS